MEFLNVLVAAVGAFAFGAVWYMSLSKSWIAASGGAVGADGGPANKSDMKPFILAFVASILVAGMMRHVFALSGIEGISKGLISGFGIGLFMVTPWMATCYAFAGRPFRLTLIDGGYATFGCAVMGAILTAF